jgi:hypothetical protein
MLTRRRGAGYLVHRASVSYSLPGAPQPAGDEQDAQ